MADSKDPSVEAMQVTPANGAVNGASRITQRTRQLSDRYDAMLPIRQIRKRFRPSRGMRLPFAPHSGGKDRRTFVSPPTQPDFGRYRAPSAKKAAGAEPAAW